MIESLMQGAIWASMRNTARFIDYVHFHFWSQTVHGTSYCRFFTDTCRRMYRLVTIAVVCIVQPQHAAKTEPP